MKINKFILRISHIFGFRKNEEHIDDVTVNISVESYTDKNIKEIESNSESVELVDDIKLQILKCFEDDAKLESRCRKTKQVWITFYKDTSDKRGGSRIKRLYYNNGVLYYPVIDRVARERDIKLEKIFNL